MKSTKFDKAFCKELGKPITPYLARELYFSEDSEYYQKKLSFICNDNKCEAELYGVNIYKSKRYKKVPHFRTKPSSTHIDECIYDNDKYNPIDTKSKKNKTERYKISNFPSEFLLSRPNSNSTGASIIEIEEEIDNKTAVSKKQYKGVADTSKKTIIKTSCLDNIVDCYENSDEKDLKSELLTIGKKTKYYYNFFKRLLYYQDEEGLIYWGEVKEIKEYGSNYKIIFKDRPYVNGEALQTSIYLENEEIEKYRKNRQFREIVEDLLSLNGTVICYFVGAYPKVIEVDYEDNSFQTLDISINNLDHITFTFEEE